MSDDDIAPPLYPRIVHAGPGQAIELRHGEGQARLLSHSQGLRVLADVSAELAAHPGDALDLGYISPFAVPRLAALRLIADLAAALASNMEAATKP